MMITLTTAQQELVCRLGNGHHLKGHRDIEGGKQFRLYHTASNQVVATPAQADIELLRSLGLLDSNMKFPAARFFLSATGQALARSMPTQSPQEYADG